MARIIRPIEHESLHRAEVGLDEIQPSGIRRRRNHGDPVGLVEGAQIGTPVGVQIVHDHVQAPSSRVAGTEPPEGGQHIARRLPAPTGAQQTIVVDIVEPQELLGPLGAAVGGS